MSGTEAVRIRMYNVGFGDCFLLGFPWDDREHLVLVDCGVHSASKGGHDLDDVIADVRSVASSATGSPRLDVVIATHRHRDHVHGFRDESTWSDIEVGEVWLPWTEHPDDPEARRIKDRQSRRSLQLQALAADETDERWAPIQAIVENNYTNAKAMTTLHRGFAGRPDRYFLPQPPDGPFAGPRSASFTTDVLPSVRIHVLGPSRDEDTIRDMDPPGDESYLRMGSGRSVISRGAPLPFERWAVDQSVFLAAYGHLDLVSADLGTIVSAGRTDALALAVGLEQAVNGTSLVLLFECGDATILMTGDAQWGTWQHLLADRRMNELATAARVLKVGHHGSHNATPRRFVERITGRPEAAFVSVAPTNIASWSDIPREPLLTELRSRWARVIRSDKADELDGSDATTPRAASEALPVEIGPDKLWIELKLPTRRD
jgi:beta-lactamase superfamily II metal-dependent hydrolase